MCHGHVDLKTVEREVQDRLRAVKPAAVAEADDAVTLPPSLTPGLRGVLARIGAAVAAIRPARSA